MNRWLIATAALLWALPAAHAAAKPAFELQDPGLEDIVDYEKYGEFQGIGTFEYKYVVTDTGGLALASGEGIVPNRALLRSPVYHRLKERGVINENPWEHLDSGNPRADFYAWATSNEDPGVRLFFIGKTLERAGQLLHAAKAYRAAMILFPRSFCWNREHTWTWLVAPAAWSALVNLLQNNPDLEMKLVGAAVKSQAAIGGDPTFNKVAVTPGRLVRYTVADRAKDIARPEDLAVSARRGGKVAVVKYANGHWGFQIDRKPFLVRGVTYSPTKVGQMISKWNWMDADENANGLNDPAQEAWMDANGNGRKEPTEKAVGDFALLKEMGVNVIRVSLVDFPINHALLREMHKKYGIHAIVTEPFGAYTLHSGARWEDGTDYRDPVQRKRLMQAVRDLAREVKDEPWLLAYVLGNENNMPADYSGVNATRTNASAFPEAYARLLNEAAKAIHHMDPNHPVGVGNMEMALIDSFAAFAPELDFIGVNSYRGAAGFGALWSEAKALIDRPVLITEFGCDAYAEGKGPDEDAQANYLRNSWIDITANAAGRPGVGNALGGVAFEWLDEWWKDTRGDSWETQNAEKTYEFPFPDGWAHEEWFGLVGQGDGRSSPFLRQPRKAYFTLKELWTARN